MLLLVNENSSAVMSEDGSVCSAVNSASAAAASFLLNALMNLSDKQM